MYSDSRLAHAVPATIRFFYSWVLHELSRFAVFFTRSVDLQPDSISNSLGEWSQSVRRSWGMRFHVSNVDLATAPCESKTEMWRAQTVWEERVCARFFYRASARINSSDVWWFRSEMTIQCGATVRGCLCPGSAWLRPFTKWLTPHCVTSENIPKVDLTLCQQLTIAPSGNLPNCALKGVVDGECSIHYLHCRTLHLVDVRLTCLINIAYLLP